MNRGVLHSACPQIKLIENNGFHFFSLNLFLSNVGKYSVNFFLSAIFFVKYQYSRSIATSLYIMPEVPSLITSAQANKLVNGLLKYILLDIDGVLWSGDKIIDGAPEALSYFRQKQLQIRFLSNNASVSRHELHQRLLQRGFDGVSVKEVYNSGYAASLRLSQVLGTREGGPSDEKRSVTSVGDSTVTPKVHGNILVIGEKGLHDEIQLVLADGFITYGLELHDAQVAMGMGGYQANVVAKGWREKILPPPFQPLTLCDGGTCRVIQAGNGNPDANKISLADLNPAAVIVGLDFHFNMLKLAVASMTLLGAPKDIQETLQGTRLLPHLPPLFIATNEDPQIPCGSDKVLLPGAGAIVKAVCTAAGRSPDMICGKPFIDMAQAFMTAENIPPECAKDSCLMIGDRLTTDVAFGNAAGMSSMFVLSGAEDMKDLESAAEGGQKQLIPDYVGKSLADFLPSSS